VIAHPFEIKPSASDANPDVLMVTWRGTPSQALAEIYLPAVSSKVVVELADKLYGRHRIISTDPNTIQFPGTDMTLVPIPAGSGRYAGLLSVDVRPSLPEGRDFVAIVRQLNVTSATARQSSPAVGAPQVAGLAVADATIAPPPAGPLLWRQVGGAFQYAVTVKSGGVLRYEQERLVAWLKWRVSITPAQNRWLPVLQRYLTYTEQTVFNLGGDPKTIPPSQVGNVTGPDPYPGSGGGHIVERESTGKIVEITFDRFGDFRGFVIETESGHERRFHATEAAIERIVREAWVERSVLKVVVTDSRPEDPERLILLRYH
jgi:hypothetical protein